MNPRMFRISVQNMPNHEETTFLGQGMTIEEALKDGVKNVQTTFRPKSDGQNRGSLGVMVKLRDGRIVNRTLRDFESDVPFLAPVATVEDLD